ncbi:helix-turn-helix domain-containing protein [Terribacillus saccharophilus]|uniref:helix-turn-helix domain-containing protein n=1 Tax=Terribacillus saccharophilus TaxID=361277 RepID=UPI00380E3A0C
MNSDNYITTKEVARRLNKSISTIYRYVNEKKLRPVYEDKWQIDSSLLFREHDVDQLMNEQQNKPGYTTGEVAAKLSKHPSTIAMYIKTGKLKTEKREYKGRILNFISEDELEKLHKEIGEKGSGYLNIFDKQRNIHLYQSFQDSKGNKARIMSLDNHGVAELEDGSSISIEKLYQLDYLPVFDVKPQRYVTKKGYVHFRFREPIHSKSTHLDIIESLLINLGEKNVKIRAEERGLNVFVKPGLLKTIKTSNLSFEYELLNTHIKSGILIRRHDGILLQTNYTQLISQVHKDVKQNLKIMAHSKGMTLDDYIEGILTKHVKEGKE